MHVLLTLPVLLALLLAAPLAAQGECSALREPTGGPYPDLYRSLGLAGEVPLGSAAVRRAGAALLRECAGPDLLRAIGGDDEDRPITVALLPAGVLVQHNSDYPRNRQDGLRWAGVGVSGGVTAGVGARWGPLSAALAPVITYQANEPVDIRPVGTAGHSRFGSYYHAGQIDLPQRFGAAESTWAHLGQSFVRLDGFGAAVGVSTENLRWGPARRNPLLMSGAGPGFFHVFAGTSEPLDVRVGRLEVEAVWGRLEESEYFDSVPDNDRRLLAGLVVAFSPGRDTGLTVGLARAYQRYLPPEGLSLSDQVFGPYGGIRENPDRAASDADNQLLSAFFRWAFPEVGFEVYGEYAREDHWEDRDDLIKELDHSRGYTVGLQKVFAREASPHRVRVAAEVSNLNMSPTWQSGRPGVTFYTHSQIRQGHTHRGQLLGAPIGPGSDAQYLEADYLGRSWRTGLWLERARYDNDVYYRQFAYRYAYSGHDAEVTAGLRGGGQLMGLELSGELAYSSRYNRGFIGLDGGVNPIQANNVSFVLGVGWAPGAVRLGP